MDVIRRFSLATIRRPLGWLVALGFVAWLLSGDWTLWWAYFGGGGLVWIALHVQVWTAGLVAAGLDATFD